MRLLISNTVNVEIFAQYIFSRMVSYARKYDVSENLNHYMLDRIRYKMRENISTRNGHIWLDARKFSCAKISTFTVGGYEQHHLVEIRRRTKTYK